MKAKNRKGNAKLGVLLFVLLCASIALNVILLKGDRIVFLGGKAGGDDTANPPPPSPQSSSESSYLRELAGMLKLDAGSDKTPGDMAFDIRQRLSNPQKYKGDVLSPESFELTSSAILMTKDRETFKAYHEFISKIAGKPIIVLE